MSSALALITEQVRERVRREGVDATSEPQLVDRFVRDEVRAYSEPAQRVGILGRRPTA